MEVPRLLAPVVALVLLISACSSSAPESDAVSPSGSPRPTASEEGDDSEAVKPRRAERLHPSEWVKGRPGEVVLVIAGAAPSGSIGKMLGVLDGRPAAFALPGRYLRRHQGLVEEIEAGGSSLVNYGWSGKRLTRGSKKKMKTSIERAETALAALAVDPRPFLVPPANERGMRVLKVAGRRGYRSVRPLYPTARRADGVVKEIAGSVRAGAIVGLRAARRSDRRALERILVRIKRSELKLAPVRRLTKVRPVRWDITLAPGAEGPRVRLVQQSLNAATYPAGEEDGVFGAATVQAVLAFEKVNGLPRDGIVSPEDMEAIVTARPPSAPPGSGSRYIDVDLTRQVLFEVEGGRVVNTYPISSANGATYTSSGGGLAIARTPRGSYSVDRKIPGWRVSYLGQLYYPVYFYGGYAIHGSPSVPAYPASHGCIRIPMHVAADFYGRISTGTPITIHD